MTVTQSTIFPCPAEPASVMVSATQAYWHRFTNSAGLTVVRLQRNPSPIITPDGDALIEYEDLEVQLTPEELATLADNFDGVWEEHEPKGEPAVNPIS